ncbi:hypothetical protein FQN54_007379 [Arachnomyces sp. PD_36]|nr:hypothetical protein FQN54_007379 [Arachnomyces sp. PD_36]
MKLPLLTLSLFLQSRVSLVFGEPIPPHAQIVENRAMASDKLDEIIAASPMLAFHRSISEIESTSGSENEVGEFIIKFLEEHNFTVQRQVVKTEGGEEKADSFNIFAYSSPDPDIILTSHIDTVPPYIPYSLSLPGDSNPEDNREKIRIAGRGTVDAKGSVAAQTFAAISHLQENPESSIGLLFVVGEETSGVGMEYFSASPLNTDPPTFSTLIFGEPTELKLISGHKGNVHFSINSKGVAAHSGYPWLGESAISALLPALSKLDKLGTIPVSEGGLPSSEKYGETTVNIGVMKGGAASNVVPESASADILVRLADGDPEEAKEIIRKAVSEATGGNKNVTLEFSGKPYPPIDLDSDVDGFEVMPVNYGTDVPHWTIHGEAGKVKRYLYGPGTIFVAHGVDEALTIGDLEEAVDGYGKLIKASSRK